MLKVKQLKTVLGTGIPNDTVNKMLTLSLNSLIFQPELIAPPVERKSIL
jgi:hypothetical protein